MKSRRSTLVRSVPTLLNLCYYFMVQITLSCVAFAYFLCYILFWWKSCWANVCNLQMFSFVCSGFSVTVVNCLFCGIRVYWHLYSVIKVMLAQSNEKPCWSSWNINHILLLLQKLEENSNMLNAEMWRVWNLWLSEEYHSVQVMGRLTLTSIQDQLG